MSDTLLVRLKDYNPRAGFHKKRFVAFGLLFTAGSGWYEVPKDVAEYLRTVREHDMLPDSPLAFDVCTEAEAKAIEEREKMAAEERRAAASAPRVHRLAGAMTAADLSAEETPRAPPPTDATVSVPDGAFEPPEPAPEPPRRRVGRSVPSGDD
jgi:hypothetical protein